MNCLTSTLFWSVNLSEVKDGLVRLTTVYLYNETLIILELTKNCVKTLYYIVYCQIPAESYNFSSTQQFL